MSNAPSTVSSNPTAKIARYERPNGAGGTEVGFELRDVREGRTYASPTAWFAQDAIPTTAELLPALETGLASAVAVG